MGNKLSISSYCRIRNRQVWVNGSAIYNDDTNKAAKDFLKDLYQLTGADYPKYFKMDTLCKLAFVAAELLLKDGILITKHHKHQIGIILSNAASSLDTDRKHQASIANSESYFPSPSLFVYTLPSIMNGEIAIRNGIQGENNFLIAERFSPTLLIEHIEMLRDGNYLQASVGGWVNIDENGNEDVLMFVVEEDGIMPLTRDTLSKTYTGNS